MTIPRLNAMHDYWKEAPPVHIGLKQLNTAFLKPASGNSSKQQEKKAGLEELIAEFGQAGGSIKA